MHLEECTGAGETCSTPTPSARQRLIDYLDEIEVPLRERASRAEKLAAEAESRAAQADKRVAELTERLAAASVRAEAADRLRNQASERESASLQRTERLREERNRGITQLDSLEKSHRALLVALREYVTESHRLQQATIDVARRALGGMPSEGSSRDNRITEGAKDPKRAQDRASWLSVLRDDEDLPESDDSEVIDLGNERDLATLDHPSRWSRHFGRRRYLQTGS